MLSKAGLTSVWRAIARIYFYGLSFAGTAKLLKAKQGKARQGKAKRVGVIDG